MPSLHELIARGEEDFKNAYNLKGGDAVAREAEAAAEDLEARIHQHAKAELDEEDISQYDNMEAQFERMYREAQREAQMGSKQADADTAARHLGRMMGIGPPEAYADLDDPQVPGTGVGGGGAQVPTKRPVGRPRKSAPATPAREEASGTAQGGGGWFGGLFGGGGGEGGGEEPAKSAAELAREEKARKEARDRRRYIKKLDYAMEHFDPKVFRYVKVPRENDWSTLTTEKLEAAYNAVVEELGDQDPEPIIRDIVVRMAYGIETVAPVIGAATKMPPHTTNLSYPYSFGEISAIAVNEEPVLRTAVRRVALQYVGEYSTSPWMDVAMGILGAAKKVAEMNAEHAHDAARRGAQAVPVAQEGSEGVNVAAAALSEDKYADLVADIRENKPEPQQEAPAATDTASTSAKKKKKRGRPPANPAPEAQ